MHILKAYLGSHKVGSMLGLNCGYQAENPISWGMGTWLCEVLSKTQAKKTRTDKKPLSMFILWMDWKSPPNSTLYLLSALKWKGVVEAVQLFFCICYYFNMNMMGHIKPFFYFRCTLDLTKSLFKQPYLFDKSLYEHWLLYKWESEYLTCKMFIQILFIYF